MLQENSFSLSQFSEGCKFEVNVQMASQKQCKPVKLYHQLYVPHHYDPELPPIIFLHGTAASHSTWSRVNTQIADKTKRKVYTVDLRNHGQSAWSEQNTLHEHEADLENFLSENQMKKCVLIGHSLGGKIAMFFALRKPELVEKVITEEIHLANPKSEDLDTALALISSAKKIHMLPKGLDELEIRNLLSRLVSEKYPNQQDFGFCIPLKKNCDGSFEFDFNIEVIERTFGDRTAFDIDFKECKQFTGPILVMYGDTVAMKLEQDEKLKEFFPNAELCKFESCTHVLHVDRSDEFIRTVSNFINQNDS